jgi:signal transduction histidine kinase
MANLQKRETTAMTLAKKTSQKPKLESINFTVDSAMLRELGERLVGQPHIALAELIKNSYDADATNVTIKFDHDRIEVSDNGHGMDFKEFKNFWMRIGSAHKQELQFSRNFQRPVTGSKGVGRLAVQFLGNKIELRTVSENDENSELQAYVNWDEAVQAGDLTEAQAKYREISSESSFPGDSSHGTAVVLVGLNQKWTTPEIVNLAREIWWLQPPFRSNPRLKSDRQRQFTVEIKSPDPKTVEEFERQMRAYLDIWYARLVGRLESTDGRVGGSGKVQLYLEFSDETKTKWSYSAPRALKSLEFEIRVFHLKYRQPYGIQVDYARKYLNEHGGVHVYDAGFHLPYYGVEHDWLDIEIDHSHRLSRSKLLPDSLQVAEGMNFLPTQSRLFGVVHVDTSAERRFASRSKQKTPESLQIQISRDRLVDNHAYRALRSIIRTAIDFYAMEEAKRALERAEALRPIERASDKFQRVDEVLSSFRDEIPKPVYSKLRENVRDAIEASQTEAELVSRQVGLLGSLATAGISALAYEHEVNVQMHLLEEVVDQIEDMAKGGRSERNLGGLSKRLREWLERARSTRALFSSLLNEENRTAKGRLKAKAIVEDVKIQIQSVARGVEIETNDVDESLRFPEAGYPEWSAIFQNVFINAINAMLDSKRKKIAVSSGSFGRERRILVQDTGSGVDLESADDLFKPFVRRTKISRARRELGLGGTGLGLTIVRMIAANLDCKVSFVKPQGNFKSAFQLSWKELR